MFKLFLVFFLSILINVQTQDEEWWYDMGDDWEVSDEMAKVNPFYAWQQQTAARMDAYAPALHVGKIYRGQFVNPELNMPADNAFGYQSDFNHEDFQSGAFNRKPQGQKIRANAAHVYEGLASYEGEVVTMPLGQHVQEDGSILMQVSRAGGDPCQPNPCTSVRMPTCTPVNRFTAKCTRNEDYKLALTWSDPNGYDSSANDIDLYLVPDFHDGSSCPYILSSSYDYLYYDEEECGAVFSDNDYVYHDDSPNLAEESVTLTTLADGTNYKSYTYAVIAFVETPYNPTEGNPTLTVEYNGVIKQTLAIPQYTQGGPNLNYMGPGEWRTYYFFGCFRPQLGYVDTRGAGFHTSSNDGDPDSTVIDGLNIFSPGLCKAILGWSSGYGFNPYDQSGSGDEAGSGS